MTTVSDEFADPLLPLLILRILKERYQLRLHSQPQEPESMCHTCYHHLAGYVVCCHQIFSFGLHVVGHEEHIMEQLLLLSYAASTSYTSSVEFWNLNMMLLNSVFTILVD
jgi:hypothetical protein